MKQALANFLMYLRYSWVNFNKFNTRIFKLGSGFLGGFLDIMHFSVLDIRKIGLNYYWLLIYSEHRPGL